MTLDIALPFYGDFELLKLTVNSVLNQSDDDWRLIVVDDGYPDPAVKKWFSQLTDDRVNYHRNNVQLGANGNYRRCLELVDSDFFVFMGADDIMLTNYVAWAKSVIDANPAVSVFQPGVQTIDEHGASSKNSTDLMKSLLVNRLSHDQVISGDRVASSLMIGNWLYFPSLVWKTSVIQKIGFRSDLNVCQDIGLAIDVLTGGGQMLLSTTQTFLYRRHKGSDSSIRAITGERFVEEKEFFTLMASEFARINWKKSKRNAQFRLGSRLHAAFLLPKAIKSKRSIRPLLSHIFR